MNASSGSGLWPKRSTWVASTKPPMGVRIRWRLTISALGAQAGEHVRMRAAGEGARGALEREEAHVGRVIAGLERSATHHRAIAQEYDAGARAMKSTEDAGELHGEPRLLARLAHGGL